MQRKLILFDIDGTLLLSLGAGRSALVAAMSEDIPGIRAAAEEIRFYDEVEKENSTLVLLKSVDLRPLEANLFTKTWLESKSR